MPNDRSSQPLKRGRIESPIPSSSAAAQAKVSAIKAKAKRIEQRVRKHHKTGRLANQAQEAERSISTTAFAKKKGLDPGTLRRWKLFAKLYSALPTKKHNGLSELDILCMLRRPNGLPLHWGYLPYLLSIKKNKARREMAEKAATEGWSPARLHAEICAKEQRPRGHGRSVTIPTKLEDGVRHVLRESQLWLARAKKLVKQLCSPEVVHAQLFDTGTKTVLAEVAKLFRDVQAECVGFSEALDTAKQSPPKPKAAKRGGGQASKARTGRRQGR